MFTNANDSTVCLLLPTPESDPVSEIYVSDEEYDDGFDDKFEAVLAKLVEFERSADPAKVEPVKAVEDSESAVSAAEPTRVVPRVWTVFLTLLLPGPRPSPTAVPNRGSVKVLPIPSPKPRFGVGRIGAMPLPSPKPRFQIGIAPLPSPKPRFRVGRVRIDPLPSPKPRFGGGRIGIEPNPSP